MSEKTDNGRFALVGPVKGGIQWWEINDMQKMYAVVSVSATIPFAEEIAKYAFEKICSWQSGEPALRAREGD